MRNATDSNQLCGNRLQQLITAQPSLSRMFPIPNEYVLLAGVSVLLVLIGWEYHDTQLLLSFGGKPQGSTVHRASSKADMIATDTVLEMEVDRAKSDSNSDAVSVNQLSTILDDVSVISEEIISTEHHRQSRFTERISVSESITNMVLRTDNSKEAIEELVSKIMSPLPPGCEPFGPNANYIAEKLPQLSRADICRFLVARKGNVQQATEMAEKCLEWRATVFPLKKDDLRAAINTGCFFPYRTARDGTPVVYMRGGLYDNVKATPEQFVLAAAYAIEYSLKMHPKQINVTVVVDTVIIPGAPNLGADMTFIKLFVKALSDNYPERLKRIVMYPFPWYGRAIWSVVKVFIDKRTQDKAMLIGDTGKREIPAELRQFVDPDNIPECCAGNCKEPILDLLSTL